MGGGTGALGQGFGAGSALAAAGVAAAAAATGGAMLASSANLAGGYQALQSGISKIANMTARGIDDDDSWNSGLQLRKRVVVTIKFKQSIFAGHGFYCD